VTPQARLRPVFDLRGEGGSVSGEEGLSILGMEHAGPRVARQRFGREPGVLEMALVHEAHRAAVVHPDMDRHALGEHLETRLALAQPALDRLEHADVEACGHSAAHTAIDIVKRNAVAQQVDRAPVGQLELELEVLDCAVIRDCLLQRQICSGDCATVLNRSDRRLFIRGPARREARFRRQPEETLRGGIAPDASTLGIFRHPDGHRQHREQLLELFGSPPERVLGPGSLIGRALRVVAALLGAPARLAHRLAQADDDRTRDGVDEQTDQPLRADRTDVPSGFLEQPIADEESDHRDDERRTRAAQPHRNRDGPEQGGEREVVAEPGIEQRAQQHRRQQGGEPPGRSRRSGLATSDALPDEPIPFDRAAGQRSTGSTPSYQTCSFQGRTGSVARKVTGTCSGSTRGCTRCRDRRLPKSRRFSVRLPSNRGRRGLRDLELAVHRLLHAVDLQVELRAVERVAAPALPVLFRIVYAHARGRELPDVEEVGGAQMVVASLDPGVERGHVHLHLDDTPGAAPRDRSLARAMCHFANFPCASRRCSRP
jgi:hypothetical protein